METEGGCIRVLDKDTINKIAAGEVIERPASAVKELVDNALDSGATDIRVEVEKGGKALVLVRDNGCGMSRKDAALSFEKHATSKLEKVEDLESVSTMGFRGEALSSIASVARVELLTRPRERLEGTKVLIEGGKIKEISDTGAAPGTTVQVRDLFYNIPARRKYLKSDRTELAHITDIVMKLALANPETSFTLINEGKTLLRNPGSKELLNTVVNLLGPETARVMLPLSGTGKDGERENASHTRVRGYVSKPELNRGGADQLFLFVNSRPVTSRALNAAIKQGYYTKIPGNRYPVAVLSLVLDPTEVDVNVHPRKTEVRFSREKEVCEAVSRAVERALSEHELVPEMRKKKPRTIQQAFRGPPVNPEGQKTKGKEKGDEKEENIPPMPALVPEKSMETPEFKAEGRQEVLEKPEPYSYPIRDTEKRLRRSERLFEELAPANETYREEKGGGTGENEEKKTGEGKKKEKREESLLESPQESPETLYAGPTTPETLTSPKTSNPELSTSGSLTSNSSTSNSSTSNSSTSNSSTSNSSTSGPSTPSPLEGLRVIGQVSRLYILAEKEGGLVIIDQHAAHERILYEQILKMKKSRVQELITPVTIELTPKEKVLMEEYIPFLEEYGFGVSEFGDNTYVVTFVPEIFGRLEGPELVHDIISDVLAGGRVRNETGVSEKLCKTLACRAAIKGGAACSPRQMEELVEQLKKVENPYSCPHGRPTIISFTREELDRMFARTV